MKHVKKKSIKNIFKRDEKGIFGLSLFKKKLTSLEEKLSAIPIFETLNVNELREVAAIVHKRSYSQDEYICYQNDPGLGMYIIDSGEAQVILMSKKNSNKQIATLSAGECFGELSLLDEAPRSASVIATTNSEIIGFFRQDLEELVSRNPQLGSKILIRVGQLVSERLRQTNVEVEKLKNELEIISTKKKKQINNLG